MQSKNTATNKTSDLVHKLQPFKNDSYISIGKKVISSHLTTLSGENAATLLFEAYTNRINTNSDIYESIRDIATNSWIWVYNQCLWTDKGVYIIRDLEVSGASGKFNVQELDKKLAGGKEIKKGIVVSQDNNIRFAAKESYKSGKHSFDSLEQDGFVIASYGIEGAKKLAQIAKKINKLPITYGIEIPKGEKPALRVEVIGEGVELFHVDGLSIGDCRSSTFGIDKTFKAQTSNP